jgi:hypothetical protein
VKVMVVKAAVDLQAGDELIAAPFERPRAGMPDLIARLNIHGVSPSGEHVFVSHEAGSSMLHAETLVAVFVSLF